MTASKSAKLRLKEIYARAEARAAAARVAASNARAVAREMGVADCPHLSNRWVRETGAASLLASRDAWFFKNLDLSVSLPEPLQPCSASPADLLSEFEQFESFKQCFLDSRGNICELLLNRNVEKEGAFIDQITFTGSLESLNLRAGIPIDTVAMRSQALSEICKEVFGWGITEQSMTSGNFFYEQCFLCKGTDKLLYAKVHFGGQHDTFCVEVKGLGVSVALEDWNKRLFRVMSADWFVRPKITRIDIAMDFFNGEYSPEQAREDRNNGLFNSANKIIPKGKCQGTEWEDMTGKDKSGKTYEIGTRNSVRFIRVYNKAAEQGVQGDWVRFEIEFGRKAIIPLDALAHPTAYFCGAAPACGKFSDYSGKEIETKKLKLACTIERQLEIFKKQAGRAFNFFSEWFADLSPEELISKLKPNHDLLPDRLNPAAWACDVGEFVDFDKMTEQQVNAALLCGF